MLAIRLNKEIHPNYILNILQQLISKHAQSNNIQDSILYIDIKTISQTSDELILKLEHTLEKLNDDRGNEVPKST